MNQKIKTIVIQTPKFILFVFALYNFICVWLQAEMSKNYGALVSPWYEPWSYWNEPSLILMAATVLLLGKRWSNLTALFLSGYLVIYQIYLIFKFGWADYIKSFIGEFKYIGDGFSAVLMIWEVQYIFAAGIFIFAVFYLIRNSSHKNSAVKLI